MSSRSRHVLGTRTGAVAAVLLLVILAVAVVGPEIWAEAARALDPAHAREGMSAAHPLGTDDLGRDILARTLVATRLSLLMALAASGLAAVSGFLVGCLAAVSEGRIRGVVTGCVQWSLAFPPVIVALFVTAVMGPGGAGAILAIGLALAPSFARVTQTLATEVVGSDYVAAARTVGVGRRRLVGRYLLPNIAEPIVIQASVTVGAALVSVSALSFLGLGIQPPAFDWGRMLAEGLGKIFTTPVVALAPATAIVVSGLAFSLLGDVIARAFQGSPTTSSRPRRVRPAERRGASCPQPVSCTSPPGDDLLVVDDLTVQVETVDGPATVVEQVSIRLRRGERVGVVGESGSAKTMTALALAQLLPDGTRCSASRMEFAGNDLRNRTPAAVRHVLGLDMAMVFQDPGTSLNPVLRTGTQLGESIRHHRGVSTRAAHRRAVQMLRDVHIPAAERRARQYPHELSGGMRQRAMIAMGLLGEPSLIVADEPTTALDVTVQSQILDLLREINQEHGTTIVLISHDVGVVAELCSRMIVMYAGRIVEDADIDTILDRPAHPYTRALIAAVPDLDVDPDTELATIPGRPPSITEPSTGCSFASRCPLVTRECTVAPPLEMLRPGHSVACWRAEESSVDMSAREGAAL